MLDIDVGFINVSKHLSAVIDAKQPRGVSATAAALDEGQCFRCRTEYGADT